MYLGHASRRRIRHVGDTDLFSENQPISHLSSSFARQLHGPRCLEVLAAASMISMSQYTRRVMRGSRKLGILSVGSLRLSGLFEIEKCR